MENSGGVDLYFFMAAELAFDVQCTSFLPILIFFFFFADFFFFLAIVPIGSVRICIFVSLINNNDMMDAKK